MATTNKHILIVEDDFSIARLIEIHLQRESYEITICDNGLDAQDLLEKNSYHAVILDRMIPGKR
ncbi:MAG: response regulator, partial [Ghiorsea sp.]|nr:response regulator [Ghiorsea sp.]